MLSRDLIVAVCLGMFTMLSACASVSVTQIENAKGSTGIEVKNDTSGVRFYRPAPYLWITQADPPKDVNVETFREELRETGSEIITETTSVRPLGGPRYTAQIVMLPDYSQEYIVQWKAGIGSVKPSVSLADGWNLSSFGAEVDSKVSDTIGAVASLGGTVADAVDFMGQDFKPGLYRIEINDGDGTLTLGDPVFTFPTGDGGTGAAGAPQAPESTGNGAGGNRTPVP